MAEPSALTFWPDALHEPIRWIAANEIGDVAGVIGILITLCGFFFTLRNTWRSRKAAEEAERAANSVRKSIARLDALSDFSRGLTILEEIQRLHSVKVIAYLPERYNALRNTLVRGRRLISDLSDEQQKILQEAITALAEAHSLVSRASQKKSAPDFYKLDRILIKHGDALNELLVDLKISSNGT